MAPKVVLAFAGTTAHQMLLTIPMTNAKRMGTAGLLHYYPRDFKTEHCWEPTK
jgi:hypothetical protein